MEFIKTADDGTSCASGQVAKKTRNACVNAAHLILSLFNLGKDRLKPKHYHEPAFTLTVFEEGDELAEYERRSTCPHCFTDRI